MRRYDGPDVKVDTSLGPHGRVVKVDDHQSVWLPQVISARIEGEAYDVEFMVINISDYPEPVIAEIKISMKDEPGAPPVSPDMVRGIKLGQARRRAVELASVPVVQDGDILHIQPGGGYPKATRAAFRRDRRNTVKIDNVRRAAEIYSEISGDPGRRDTLLGVASALGVSRATAARYITRARGLGFLPEVEQ